MKPSEAPHRGLRLHLLPFDQPELLSQMAKDMPDYICITTPSQSRKCTEGFEGISHKTHCAAGCYFQSARWGIPYLLWVVVKAEVWCDKKLWSAALLRLPSPPLHLSTREPGDSNFFQDILAQLPSCPRCDFGISHLFYSSFLDSKLLSGASRRDPPSRQEKPLNAALSGSVCDSGFPVQMINKWFQPCGSRGCYVWGRECQELADHHNNIKNPNM